jgi:hypothetical protein
LLLDPIRSSSSPWSPYPLLPFLFFPLFFFPRPAFARVRPFARSSLLLSLLPLPPAAIVARSIGVVRAACRPLLKKNLKNTAPKRDIRLSPRLLRPNPPRLGRTTLTSWTRKEEESKGNWKQVFESRSIDPNGSIVINDLPDSTRLDLIWPRLCCDNQQQPLCIPILVNTAFGKVASGPRHRNCCTSSTTSYRRLSTCPVRRRLSSHRVTEHGRI